MTSIDADEIRALAEKNRPDAEKKREEKAARELEQVTQKMIDAWEKLIRKAAANGYELVRVVEGTAPYSRALEATKEHFVRAGFEISESRGERYRRYESDEQGGYRNGHINVVWRKKA